MTTEPHVLVCDDSIEEIRVLVSMLRQSRYRLSIATNGRDACTRAGTLQPDAILMDVRMPVMDGIATCRILKAHNDTKRIPVIFLSAASDVRSRLECLRSGAVDYIVKPANEEEVLLRLRTHLRRTAPSEDSSPLGIPAADVPALVTAGIKLLEGDLSWTPSVEDLCEKLGVSRPRLTAAFREAFGTTFHEWLRERRMQQAKDWLMNSEISVNTIAANLGFNSPGNFSTAFKSRYNRPPREFRQFNRVAPGSSASQTGSHPG